MTRGEFQSVVVENNQASMLPPLTSSSAHSWLPGLIKLPGLTGETTRKGDGLIVDTATELDPSIKPGSLISPTPGPKAVEALVTAMVPDWLKDAFSGPLSMAGYNPNQSAIGNMKAFLNSPGFGSDLGGAAQKTSYRIDGQSVYKATDDVGNGVKTGDYFYLDGLHKDHLEVFDSRGNFRAVVNLDGTVNDSKTDSGSGRKINVK